MGVQQCARTPFSQYHILADYCFLKRLGLNSQDRFDWSHKKICPRRDGRIVVGIAQRVQEHPNGHILQ